MGTAEGKSSDGRIIVKCANLPDIGCPVFDNNRKRIGTVKRVFGPVAEPYASIAVTDKDFRGAEGSKLYSNNKGSIDGKAKRRN